MAYAKDLALAENSFQYAGASMLTQNIGDLLPGSGPVLPTPNPTGMGVVSGLTELTGATWSFNVNLVTGAITNGSLVGSGSNGYRLNDFNFIGGTGLADSTGFSFTATGLYSSGSARPGSSLSDSAAQLTVANSSADLLNANSGDLVSGTGIDIKSTIGSYSENTADGTFVKK
jgi:hypothetical protein